MRKNCKISFGLTVLMSLLLCAACNRAYYGPTDLHVTPLKAENDMRIGGQFTVIGQAAGVGAQTIIPLRRGLAIKGQANVLAGRGEITSFTTGLARTCITGFAANAEALIGSHRQVRSRLWVALFAGGGLNRLSHKYNGKFKSSLNFSRLCLQPEVVLTGKFADVGFGVRSSYLNYFYGSIHAQMPAGILSDYITIEDNRENFVTEGQFMLGGGKGRFYIRNSVTWMLHQPKQPYLGRLQVGTSLLYALNSK